MRILLQNKSYLQKTYIYIHTHTHTYIHIYTYIYIYIYICVCMYMYKPDTIEHPPITNPNLTPIYIYIYIYNLFLTYLLLFYTFLMMFNSQCISVIIFIYLFILYNFLKGYLMANFHCDNLPHIVCLNEFTTWPFSLILSGTRGSWDSLFNFITLH